MKTKNKLDLILAVKMSKCPTQMKLKLAVTGHLLNVHTKFQIDILKHVEKKFLKQ